MSQDDLAVQQEFIGWQNPGSALLGELSRVMEHSQHADWDAEELRLAVFGKRGGHGGRAIIEYGLIDLEKRAVIDGTGFQGTHEKVRGLLGRYRFVRALGDDEVDEAEVEAKRKRDLTRLLRVLELSRSADLREYVNAYFEL
jgi:hypothetical protein